MTARRTARALAISGAPRRPVEVPPELRNPNHPKWWDGVTALEPWMPLAVFAHVRRHDAVREWCTAHGYLDERGIPRLPEDT